MKKLFILILTLALCVRLDAANEKRMVIISGGDDIESFKALSEIGLAIGVTHMDCSRVEPSIWQWDIDRYDPYTNWSMKNATLFKYVVPEQLKPYIPADYVGRNMDNMKKKASIIRKLGMKAYLHFMDPAFLPEQAYRDHPEWRGPRCDQARRSRSEYYAPCIDNPEMRKMFVDAFAELNKVVPVEYLSILCGDSGSGLCWYEHLYPGGNGPESCKSRPFGDRLLDFMNMWQEGAAKSGVTTKVNVNHIYDQENILPRMKEGQYLQGKTASSSNRLMSVGTSWYADSFFPVRYVTNMVLAIEQLRDAQRNPQAPLYVTVNGPEQEDMIRLLKMYFSKPIADGPLGIAGVMHDVAASFVGEADAETLSNVWVNLDRIFKLIKPYNTGGMIYALGTVHQRWLTRPFVAFPEELKGDDFHYWRDFLFQAQEEEKAYDMLDLQAHRWLDGYGGKFLVTNTSRDMLSMLGPCISAVTGLEDKAVDKASAKYLRGLELRLRLYRCIIKNARNAVDFQWLMDSADKKVTPKDKTQKINWQGDEELVAIKQLTRDEIDNCFAIIKLLDAAQAEGITILDMAPKKEWETVLTLGPDIRDQLRHKVRIMEDHRMDFLRIWKTKNR